MCNLPRCAHNGRRSSGVCGGRAWRVSLLILPPSRYDSAGVQCGPLILGRMPGNKEMEKFKRGGCYNWGVVKLIDDKNSNEIHYLDDARIR